MKYIYLYELLFIYEIQVEIERSDSTNEILAGLEKKPKEYKEQLEKRRKKKWVQINFRETSTWSSYKHDFKYQKEEIVLKNQLI